MMRAMVGQFGFAPSQGYPNISRVGYRVLACPANDLPCGMSPTPMLWEAAFGVAQNEMNSWYYYNIVGSSVLIVRTPGNQVIRKWTLTRQFVGGVPIIRWVQVQ